MSEEPSATSAVAVVKQTTAFVSGGAVTAKIFDPLAVAKTAQCDADDCRESKKPDGWLRSSKHGAWIRLHHRPRQCLFTPLNVRSGPPHESLSSTRLSVIRYITDPTKGEVEYIDSTPTRMVDQWTDQTLAHKRIGYWIGETWLFDRLRPDGSSIPDLASVQTPNYISVSALLGPKRPAGKLVNWGIAEIYEYVVPGWCLKTPCPVRERTRKPYLPENADSEETYLSDLYARQIADAQMRATRRGQKAGSPPAYLFAPVFWSDTGNVFVFRPTWTINTSEDEVEEYFYASPALNR